MLLPRVITALFGIPLVAGFIWVGGIPFFFFILGIIIFSLYEYYTVMSVGLKPVDPFSLFFCGIILPFAVFFNGDYYPLNIGIFLPLFISLSFILPLLREVFAKERYLERPAYTSFGIMLISFGLAHLPLIRDLRPDGRILTFAIIITVWVMDTAAYFIGKKFGKNKLSSVSPKKTVEGFFAALAFAALTMWIFHFYISAATAFYSFLLAMLIGLAGQYSDLAESLIKRAAGVKDSSNLLPGHGGVLDRFDSYLFIAPLTYYFLVLTR
ncbi:MAG: phosphatidate cytidylyltransferase [Elusimicrobia bacterium]|nr:phosphatidate cytidylyltransferase [Elusimicrobiota bacterium]